MKPARAAVDPVTLTLLAIVGIAIALAAPSSSTPGKKHFWEFWKKNPITQAMQAREAVDVAKREADRAAAAAEAKVSAEREKQLKLAQDAAIATGVAIDAATSTTSSGKLPVKELATAKTLSATNVQAMDQAIGAAAPERVRELEAMIANLNTGVAAGNKALELLQGNLDKTVNDKAKALGELEAVKASSKAAIELAEGRATAAEQKERTWALERDAIARSYENLKFWGCLGIAVLILLVGGTWLRGAAAARLNHDLVAGTEWLRSKIPENLTAAVDEEWRKDWVTAADGTAAAVEKIKQKLRL